MVMIIGLVELPFTKSDRLQLRKPHRSIYYLLQEIQSLVIQSPVSSGMMIWKADREGLKHWTARFWLEKTLDAGQC